MGLRIDYWYVW